MNILVAGGAGFLGSHLVDRLLADEHKVCVIDSFVTGFRDNLRLHPNLEVMNDLDIVDLPTQFDMKRKFDVVFNFACPASPKAYQANPIHTMMTSVVGTKNLLDLCRETGAKFIFASTSEIYGDPINHPQFEEDWGNVNPIGIRANYDEGKRAAETLCFDYFRQYHVKIKIARIFNTYGPRMAKDDGRVVSNFIVAALRGEKQTIYGTGKQTRSFCYVDDLIAGFIALMNTPDNITGPINLGNANETSVSDLAVRIRAMVRTGEQNPNIAAWLEWNETVRSLTYVHAALPKDDPSRRKPSIKKAFDTLQWEPKVQLPEGLQKTIEYFRSVL